MFFRFLTVYYMFFSKLGNRRLLPNLSERSDPRHAGKGERRMKAVKGLIAALCLLAWYPFQALAAEKDMPVPVAEAAALAVSGSDYRIGPGDALNIEVWKDPSLSRPATVLPDGKISYPMIGETVAAGKTVSQLKKEIEKRLSAFVKDAVVTVEVRQVASLQVYVIGSVRTPGRINCTSNIDVLQALATAGGFDPFAKKSRIQIFRREEGKIVVIPFDYDDVASGDNLESNILLRRGDVSWSLDRRSFPGERHETFFHRGGRRRAAELHEDRPGSARTRGTHGSGSPGGNRPAGFHRPHRAAL